MSYSSAYFLGVFLSFLNWLIWKDPDAGKDWRWEEKGTTEDEMVGWHHWLTGPEFEQALAVGDGQGSLACCSPWGHKESDTTERLNWMEQWRSEVLATQSYSYLRPHELQHSRPPCPSPTPRVYPNPCPSSRWCNPTISSSVVPFSSHLQSFPASGSFQWVSSSH